MSKTGYQLELTLCTQRQQRLRRCLQTLGVDHALLTNHAQLQYFTGFRPHPLLQALLLISSDGDTVVVAPNQIPEHCAADEVLTFEAQWLCTLCQDQLSATYQVLKQSKYWPVGRQRIGVEGALSGALSLLIPDSAEQLIDLEPELWKLRRRKDSDELVMMRHAIAGTERMYAKAREIIEPGITELEVYSQLQRAVAEFFGEPPTASGNDFQCNSPGGPPRSRAAEAGELFILDLGPAYRGYYADNCRTFAVNQKPTDEQYRAWQAIVDVLKWLEQAIKPGVSAREIYQQAFQRLEESHPGCFPHHLGHGVGLFPHETPHLNQHWDDCFEEGDVFTAEPGLYALNLQAGIRLEENYLVTSTGVEKMTSFPLEL